MKYQRRSSAFGEEDKKEAPRGKEKDASGEHLPRHPFSGFKWLEPFTHTLVKAVCIEFIGEKRATCRLPTFAMEAIY